MALMISRMEVESPPGVSISRMTSGLARLRAVSSPCSMYCAVAGPIAPRISSPRAGAVGLPICACAATGAVPAPAGVWAAPMDVATAHTIRPTRVPVIGARSDVGLLIWRLRLLPACSPRVARQAGVLGAEGAVPLAFSGGRLPGPCTRARAPPFTRLARSRRLVRRNELLPAVADQVAATHAAQRLPQHRPVVGIVIAQERLVQAPHLQALRHPHLAAAAAQALERVFPRVIHRRRGRHRRGQEGLHLVGAKA